MLQSATQTTSYRRRIAEASDWLRKRIGDDVRVGIVAGTGLGPLADSIGDASIFPYHQIPHFPTSTVASHDGVLVAGTLSRRKVICLKGRVHAYEGMDAATIVFPTRVLAHLGIRILIVTNAAGGLNPAYARSDLMLIADQVNLMGDNPLIGVDDDAGPHFLDTTSLYSPRLQLLAQSVADSMGIELRPGVYAGIPGPNLETRAEYRMLGRMGVDAIGMSTTMEAIAAHASGVEVCGFSIITDECFPDTLQPVMLQDVLDAAAEGGPKLSRVVEGMIGRFELAS